MQDAADPPGMQQQSSVFVAPRVPLTLLTCLLPERRAGQVPQRRHLHHVRGHAPDERLLRSDCGGRAGERSV